METTLYVILRPAPNHRDIPPAERLVLGRVWDAEPEAWVEAADELETDVGAMQALGYRCLRLDGLLSPTDHPSWGLVPREQLDAALDALRYPRHKNTAGLLDEAADLIDRLQADREGVSYFTPHLRRAARDIRAVLAQHAGEGADAPAEPEYPAPDFPGYVPVAPYYSDDVEAEEEARALYHDQYDWDDEVEVPVLEEDRGYVLVCVRMGRARIWNGEACSRGFDGQPPPDAWVMKREEVSE